MPRRCLTSPESRPRFFMAATLLQPAALCHQADAEPAALHAYRLDNDIEIDFVISPICRNAAASASLCGSSPPSCKAKVFRSWNRRAVYRDRRAASAAVVIISVYSIACLEISRKKRRKYRFVQSSIGAILNRWEALQPWPICDFPTAIFIRPSDGSPNGRSSGLHRWHHWCG